MGALQARALPQAALAAARDSQQQAGPARIGVPTHDTLAKLVRGDEEGDDARHKAHPDLPSQLRGRWGHKRLAVCSQHLRRRTACAGNCCCERGGCGCGRGQGWGSSYCLALLAVAAAAAAGGSTAAAGLEPPRGRPTC